MAILLTMNVVLHHTDGVTADIPAISAGVGTNTYDAIEYYPAGQTVTQRYYVTDAVANTATIAGLAASTAYKFVIIGDSVESVNFTTDVAGAATFNLVSDIDISNGTLGATLYDANNAPMEVCTLPQEWATSVRVTFIRADGWCFYSTMSLDDCKTTTNALLAAGLFDKIVIRSQDTGYLIPAGTTFKLLKPGFTHADSNPYLFSATTPNHVREFSIEFVSPEILPESSSQDWALLITETGTAPCGDDLDYIEDTYLDTILNAQADGSVTLGIPGLVTIDPVRDTDADGITDIIEGGPATDTDGDTVVDYVDFDSDADGIPDFVEGTADANNNTIPAFQDVDEGQDHWYAVTGIPGEMVTMVDYMFNIEHYAHTRIGNKDLHVEITGPMPLNFSDTSFDVSAGCTKEITMLLSAPNPNMCASTYPENPLMITIVVSYEDATGAVQTEIFTYEFDKVDFNDEYPYKGNIVKWMKVDNAVSYVIYRKDVGELSYSPLDSVLDNSICILPDQYFIDRTGQARSFYQVAAVFADGTESELSNALRSDNFSIPLCTIQGVVSSISGRPIKDANVSARLKKAPAVITSVGMYKFNQSTLTDINGAFAILAPQGSTILLSIDDVGLREELLVPLAPAADLQEMLELNNSEALT